MNLVTLKELAEEFGVERSSLRKWIVKNEFASCSVRSNDSRGQLSLAFTEDIAEQIREKRHAQGFCFEKQFPAAVSNIGMFYAIQVAPDLRPERIKLGFATNLVERLAAHRTASPTASVLLVFPCRRTWEFAAIDAITDCDCIPLSNEVFDFQSLEELAVRATRFFSLLPDPNRKTEPS